MCSKYIFVPLTISIDQTRRALVIIVLPCYGALEIVGVIIIIIIIIIIAHVDRLLPLAVPVLSSRGASWAYKWSEWSIRIPSTHVL